MIWRASPKEALDALAPAWRAQEAGGWRGEPAATWAWQAAAIEHFQPRSLLVLGGPERPLACLNVLERGPLRLGGPLGRGDRIAPAAGAEPAEVAAAVSEASRELSLVLPSVDPERFGLAALTGSRFRSCESDQRLVIEAQDVDAYLAGRSRNLRKTLRRAGRRLQERGGAIETLPPGATAGSLAEITGLEAAGHRDAGLVLGGESGPFVKDLIARLDAEGRVRTCVARLDRELVAYLIGFWGPRDLVLYTMGFRADLTELSLGSQIYAELIAEGLRSGRAVDLGAKRTPFKERFADTSLPLLDLTAGRPPAAPVLLAALRLRRRLRRRQG